VPKNLIQGSFTTSGIQGLMKELLTPEEVDRASQQTVHSARRRVAGRSLLTS
jgi:hypothetical protein